MQTMSGKSYNFGTDFNYTKNGVTVRRYDNRDITWEKAYKSNYGVEFTLFDGLNIQADYFTEHRTNILMDRESIPSTMGLSAKVRANVGEAKARGSGLVCSIITRHTGMACGCRCTETSPMPIANS